MQNYNFIAIDFETANSNPDSACAMALVLVKDNVVKKRLKFLIKPPYYDFTFTHIHAITWQDVCNCLSFGDTWGKVENILDSVQFIAAHNAKFDKNVLVACCKRCNIKIPQIPFVCTVEISRYIWRIYPTNLPAVCRALGIVLDHHEPLSDADACAEIVLKGLQMGVNIKRFYQYSKNENTG